MRSRVGRKCCPVTWFPGLSSQSVGKERQTWASSLSLEITFISELPNAVDIALISIGLRGKDIYQHASEVSLLLWLERHVCVWKNSTEKEENFTVFIDDGNLTTRGG